MTIEMKILLVEDDEQDQNNCKNAVSDFQDDYRCTVDLMVCSNVEEARHALNEQYFDGAIIDMKLEGQGDEGNQVITQIKESFRRIPIIIYSATPYVTQTDNFPLINSYVKGEDIKYYDVIKNFWDIYNTGITKIMGGTGVIAKKLSLIFINNILPQIDSWSQYGEQDSQKTEKALLRHTLNHLIHYLDDDVVKCYPEEMYIHPSISSRVNTGCIIESKNDADEFYIVLSPACDLAERQNGQCNTDRALLAKIDSKSAFLEDKGEDNWGPKIQNAYDAAKTNRTNNYHWLPKADFFDGGLINFRKISTYTKEELHDKFKLPFNIQVSSPFLKDIVARFSSYYARQGQPDIDRSFNNV